MGHKAPGVGCKCPSGTAVSDLEKGAGALGTMRGEPSLNIKGQGRCSGWGG